MFSCIRLLFLLGVLLTQVQGHSLPKPPPPLHEVYFSPHDGVAEKLIALIDQETAQVKAAVYCLMHTGVAKALKRAHARGVDVEVIVDPYSVKVRSPIAKMVEAGIPVHVWVDPLNQTGSKKPLMHNKFCVLGDHSVWTGSFNFTRKGTLSNRENVVVINDFQVTKDFLKEFEAIKTEGCRSYTAYIEERNAKKGI